MKRTVIFLFSTLLLSACATTQPTHIALDPTLGDVTFQTARPIPIHMDTIDIRNANFIVRINNDDDAAQLISPSEPIRQQLAQVFRDGMIKIGYQIDPSAYKTVQFQLESLLTDVTETTFGYEAKTEVIINVIAKNKTQEFTKIYKGRGTLTGPFSSDFATLELDINKLLNKLSTEILNDTELHHFIEQQ
ncbi:YajG family lipoprotein [Shewanella intestini]|uniref:Lipoprotein n=1 Tax=Shewanella intestini TaxID=2017544 RepID=A0ABS5HXN8_9GAMM|nr:MULTISPECIES: YajG family lipoprotein [Shewanella]MBR9726381.1 hypothetical protein [Shewanella intestini]MRG35053.1 hypothetical protein [Shewanella sp. XMDDZSB0408]